jgi:pSer/pThr/pTyr-binding forkhead associated (FHA) protein
MARYWIRLRATEIHLPDGEVLIGRGPECFLRIDEAVVSRRHAQLRVAGDRVILEDLGSRNGSLVNGLRIDRPVLLNAGDVITIGSQQFTLESDEALEGQLPTGQHRVVDPRRRRPSPVTPADPLPAPVPTRDPSDPALSLPLLSSSASLGHCSRCGAPQGDAAICPRCGQAYRNEFSDMPTTNTGQASSYHLFWALSDKVLAMGRIDEAERMMGPRLEELLARAQAGAVPQEGMVAESVKRALRLAAATRRERWLGWIFDYARTCRYPLPLVLLDELYAQIFTLRPALGPQILAYAKSLQDRALDLRLSTLRRLCRD